jgi:hypothetical protein
VPTEVLIGLVSGLLLLVAFGLLDALDGVSFAAVLAYWSLYTASLVVLGRPGRDWHPPAVGASVPAGLRRIRLATARTWPDVRRAAGAALARTGSDVRRALARTGTEVRRALARTGTEVRRALARTGTEVRRAACVALARTRQVLPVARVAMRGPLRKRASGRGRSRGIGVRTDG